MADSIQKDELMKRIAEKRKLMINAAELNGYTSGEVVKYSQQLDMLLNKYQQIELEEKNKTNGPFRVFVTKMKSLTFQEPVVYQTAEK
ncbi:Spo0E family sporulation regulatory protein-aspartic acid phosphatase [Metabacillus sp. RGM 3146]|uniref:Spo0E family sporulation regulatory protein-aspartic acid phosphatase n=1 Tax=Metabacillus sp. RGM 3146 TaxID=3401092 RepID=UPI003B9B3B42